MSFWYPLLKPCMTTYHSIIVVFIRIAIEQGLSTSKVSWKFISKWFSECTNVLCFGLFYSAQHVFPCKVDVCLHGHFSLCSHFSYDMKHITISAKCLVIQILYVAICLVFFGAHINILVAIKLKIFVLVEWSYTSPKAMFTVELRMLVRTFYHIVQSFLKHTFLESVIKSTFNHINSYATYKFLQSHFKNEHVTLHLANIGLLYVAHVLLSMVGRRFHWCWI